MNELCITHSFSRQNSEGEKSKSEIRDFKNENRIGKKIRIGLTLVAGGGSSVLPRVYCSPVAITSMWSL